MHRAVIACLALLPGCATIVEGTSQDIRIVSNPPSAACLVERDGARIGTVARTPGNLRLDKSRHDLLVTCDREGHLQARQTVPSRAVLTTAGNILLGGIVGLVADAATGANFVYPPEVVVELSPVEVAPAPQPAPIAPSLPPVSARTGAAPAGRRRRRG